MIEEFLQGHVFRINDPPNSSSTNRCDFGYPNFSKRWRISAFRIRTKLKTLLSIVKKVSLSGLPRRFSRIKEEIKATDWVRWRSHYRMAFTNDLVRPRLEISAGENFLRSLCNQIICKNSF